MRGVPAVIVPSRAAVQEEFRSLSNQTALSLGNLLEPTAMPQTKNKGMQVYLGKEIFDPEGFVALIRITGPEWTTQKDIKAYIRSIYTYGEKKSLPPLSSLLRKPSLPWNSSLPRMEYKDLYEVAEARAEAAEARAEAAEAQKVIGASTRQAIALIVGEAGNGVQEAVAAAAKFGLVAIHRGSNCHKTSRG